MIKKRFLHIFKWHLKNLLKKIKGYDKKFKESLKKVLFYVKVEIRQDLNGKKNPLRRD